MLSELNMHSKKVTDAKVIHKYYNEQFYIPVPETGIFYSAVKAGDNVVKDTVLGYVKDVFGNELATIKAPESGIVLYKIGTPPVNKGETMFCIAKEQSAN